MEKGINRSIVKNIGGTNACAERGGSGGDNLLPAGELIQYWCAIAVAEELHFTRAAQRLHLDQSAVSRHIQKLETRLGFKLFIRTGRGVELSEAGKSFVPYARKTLLSAEQGERLAQAIARGDPQKLEVAYSPLVDLHLIAQMRGLAEAEPLHLPVGFRSVSTERLAQRIYDGVSHAAIGILPVNDDLACICILRERLYVAMPLSHRLAQRRAIQTTQLGDDAVNWMFGSRDSLVSKHLMSLFHRVGYLPNIAREAQSASEALGLVREGFGIAYVKKSELRLKPDGIVILPLAESEVAVETGFIYPPEPRWELLKELASLVAQYFRCGDASVSV